MKKKLIAGLFYTMFTIGWCAIAIVSVLSVAACIYLLANAPLLSFVVIGVLSITAAAMLFVWDNVYNQGRHYKRYKEEVCELWYAIS